ncbi:MAG TPA: radical SAM protein [Acidimicrobiales bacterium]|nr:radical SAM protein [Acidimicrobiales bacterium]
MHGRQRLLVESSSRFFDRQSFAKGLHGPSLTRTISYPQGDLRVSQQPAAVVVELTDDCNATCRTCIAGSFEGAGNYKSLDQLGASLKVALEGVDVPPVVFISGGEPTIHPDFEGVIELAYGLGVGHVVLITNGKRIAEEPQLAKHLKYSFPDLEVFLQFDAIDREVLLEIRGIDLSETRRAASERLSDAGVYTTFVSVVKEGRSLELIGSTVEYATSLPYVRGVNFQPLRASGRHGEGGIVAGTAPTIGGMIRALSTQLPFVSRDSIAPHPLAPGSIAIGHWDRVEAGALSVSTVQPSGLLIPPPSGSADVFRIMVVNYIDKYNLRSDLVEEAPIFVATDSGEVLPLDLYYLLGIPPVGAVPVHINRRPRSDQQAGTRV